MKLISAIVCMIAAGTLVSACSTDWGSRVDRNRGSAVHDNSEAMIANPEGSPAEHDPGRDTDGYSEELAARKLRESSAGKKGGAPPAINLMVPLGGK